MFGYGYDNSPYFPDRNLALNWVLCWKLLISANVSGPGHSCITLHFLGFAE